SHVLLAVDSAAKAGAGLPTGRAAGADAGFRALGAAQADHVLAGGRGIARTARARQVVTARVAMRRGAAPAIRRGLQVPVASLVTLPGAVGHHADCGYRRGTQDSHLDSPLAVWGQGSRGWPAAG